MNVSIRYATVTCVWRWFPVLISSPIGDLSTREANDAYTTLTEFHLTGPPIQPPPEHPELCPDSWQKFGAFCYLPFPHRLMWWHDAEENCQREGGDRAHLPTITKYVNAVGIKMILDSYIWLRIDILFASMLPPSQWVINAKMHIHVLLQYSTSHRSPSQTQIYILPHWVCNWAKKSIEDASSYLLFSYLQTQ